MGRMVIGGYGNGNLNFHIDDKPCRAMQNVVLTQLSTGKGLFLRYAGTLKNGQSMLTAVWISPSSPLRFEYDGDVMPDIDEELVAGYQMHVDNLGGIVVASKAEMDQWAAEEEVSESSS